MPYSKSRKPKLSRSTKSMISQIKSGTDVVPKQITTCSFDEVDGYNEISFNGESDNGALTVNALRVLYDNESFTALCGMYKEYRLKQIKIHTIIKAVGHHATPLYERFFENGVMVATSWQRSSVFEDTNVLPLPNIVVKSDSTIRHISHSNPKWEIWSSCTASNSGGEGTWLNSSYEPQTAPNTGIFFCPKFFMGFAVSEAAMGFVNVIHEIEFIVDFRGAK